MQPKSEAMAMATLEQRDKVLEQWWEVLADIPINPDTEQTEEQFLHFPVGTDREEIWHWFDKRHSNGVAYLLYSGAEDYVPETRRLYDLKKRCFDCESADCAYNCGGLCRFLLIYERTPEVIETEGCLEYVVGGRNTKKGSS